MNIRVIMVGIASVMQCVNVCAHGKMPYSVLNGLVFMQGAYSEQLFGNGRSTTSVSLFSDGRKDFLQLSSDQEKRRGVFKIFSELDHEASLKPLDNAELGNYFLTAFGLEIFAGKNSSRKQSLLAQLHEKQAAHTAAGFAFSAKLLSKQETDIPLLQKRQELIKELMRNTELAGELGELLKEINKQEAALFKFWEKPYMEELEAYADPKKNENAMLSRATQLIGPAIAATGLVTAIWGWVQEAQPIPRAENHKMLTFSALMARVCGPMFTFMGGVLMKTHLSAAALFKQRVLPIADLVENMKKVAYFVEKNPLLKQNLENYSRLTIFAKTPDALSADLAKLITLLKQVKESNAFFGYAQIYASYYLLKRIKHEFLPALEAVGEIDAYLHIAGLMNSSQDGKQYSFVDFLKDSDAPLSIEGLWNPLNSQEQLPSPLSYFKPQEARTVLIAGPQDGRAAACVSSLGQVVVLAQTFGIAPAKRCVMHPFEQLTVLSKEVKLLGMSLGSEQFKDLLVKDEEARSMIVPKQGGRALVLVDSLFEEYPESQAGYLLEQFMRWTAEQPGIRTVVSTHVERPTLLKKEASVATYHFALDEQVQGGFKKVPELRKGRNEWWFADALKRDRYIASLLAAA